MVPYGDSIRQFAMQRIHACACNLPLTVLIDIDDVADMACKNNVLPLLISHDPIGMRNENLVGNRAWILRVGLSSHTRIRLRVWNEDDTKGIRRWNIQAFLGNDRRGWPKNQKKKENAATEVQ
jgi:hypothetical protein